MQFNDTQYKKVTIYLKRHLGEPLAVADVASALHLPHSTVRYLLVDMENKGVIKRIPIKAFNVHYVRYTYEVLNQEAQYES